MKLTTGTLGVIVGGIAIVLGLLTVIIVTGHDPSQYIGSITTILTLTGFGTYLSQKVEKVDKQTNGTNSTLRDQNTALHQELTAVKQTLAAKTGETYTSASDPSPEGD